MPSRHSADSLHYFAEMPLALFRRVFRPTDCRRLPAATLLPPIAFWLYSPTSSMLTPPMPGHFERSPG
jgi:hypothetical protein